ncbi:MAG: cyclic pyranopterin monophosphate synthase MoaC [Rhodobacteraceae bacterium]|nr:cyclic pyranopterin monophosphate synthase MoaC [Paracoccaceae bacterium]
MSDLTHFDEKGAAHMVDITQKKHTDRIAIASAWIRMKRKTFQMITQGGSEKGDVLGVARIAGIMGAKKTAELIPLCHPLAISNVSIEFKTDEELPGIIIEAIMKTTGQTGVEMEALTAVSVTALTIYDMVKAVDKTMEIGGLRVLLKDGGKSGHYQSL